MKKPRNEKAQRKWMVRAVCRPPKIQGSTGKAASMVGDMVRPVGTISGPRMKITETIGQLLQAIVVPRRLAMGKFQPGMIDDLVRQMGNVAAGGRQGRGGHGRSTSA